MLIADVNIYLPAYRKDSPQHEIYRGWLEEQLLGSESFGVSELVLSAFVRIITNHRVYKEPTTPEAALDFCQTVLDAPATVRVQPGERHWSIFHHLCLNLRARANDVPDAYLAALALEREATFITVDRGFRRFPSLRIQSPLDFG
ncbi:MAG: type II toxin-antitoxin system VapC family toxin [Candidatus Dormibacteraceae bacterium]